MIGKIAVSAANFAIDKPYSYQIPEGMDVRPGMRVIVPFGKGNRRSEGVVLSLEADTPQATKCIEQVMDPEPILSMQMLRLAAFMRERYFCTFYDAIRVMLPARFWFKTSDVFCLTEDLSWQKKTVRKLDALKILEFLQDCGGQTTESALKTLIESEDSREAAIRYLLQKKWIHSSTWICVLSPATLFTETESRSTTLFSQVNPSDISAVDAPLFTAL